MKYMKSLIVKIFLFYFGILYSFVYKIKKFNHNCYEFTKDEIVELSENDYEIRMMCVACGKYL